MTAVPILAAEGATVTMGDVTLLEPTSFAVLPGEVWCLTGGNGSGKTTLLRAFLGSRSLDGRFVFGAGRTRRHGQAAAPAPRGFLGRRDPVRP